MHKLNAAVFLLLLTPSIFAQPPSVKVPEKIEGQIASFIILRAETDAKTVMFYPIDEGINVFPSELLADKKATVITAAKPGRYRILVYTGNENGPSSPAICVVLIKGTEPEPQPEPDPKPKPDGDFGLRKLSRDATKKVTSAVRQREQKALAAAIRGHASAVAAGAYDQYTGENYAAWVMHGLRQATGNAATASEWQPWTKDISPALEKLYREGKLSGKTKWAAAFEEIAQGLED